MGAATPASVRRQHAIARATTALAAAAVLSAAPVRIAAQPALPFALGERLTYRVHAGIAGTIGRGTMSVEGPVEVRGATTYLLRSDFRGRIAFLGGSDRCESWFDPERMAVLRFEKTERQPFRGHEERVTVFPSQMRWATDAGRTGNTPTDAPLDELAFIYYVRTMPLAPDSAYRISRHYDPARNPVEVRVLGHETVRTEAGVFATVLVEMRVKDPRRFEREGIIRLNLTTDAHRIPVRMESSLPMVGKAVFVLEAFVLGKD